MILDQGTVKFLIATAEKLIGRDEMETDGAGVLVPARVDAALENHGANKILNMLRYYEGTDNRSE